ncbi:diguanylate cyclase [Stappia sp.]|uniref:diguanylate cyclase n=1 Tax=Stappia sp. TaxID=1870903 RepID=UPI0032D8BCB4
MATPDSATRPTPYLEDLAEWAGPGDARAVSPAGQGAHPAPLSSLFSLLRRVFDADTVCVILRDQAAEARVYHEGAHSGLIATAPHLERLVSEHDAPVALADVANAPETALRRHLLTLGLGFFVGRKLSDDAGRVLGVLCLAHPQARPLPEDASALLQDAGHLVVREIQHEIAERIAQRSWETLVEAIETLPDGFVLYDEDDRLTICNEQYRQSYPQSAHVIRPGNTFEDIVREGVRCGQYAQAVGREEDWIAERLAAHRAPDGPVEQEMPDGRWLRVLEKRLPGGGTVGFRVDITELKQRQHELYDLAHRDELTGTMSRRAILAAARRAAAGPAGDRRPLALLILDIDHFKRVNDRYGHFAGDDVLKAFCTRITHLLRERDHFGRLGGEEFLALLPDTNLDAAVAVAERLRAALACRPVEVNGQSIPVTVSIGVTAFTGGEAIDDAFARADRFLYQAKQDGRNRVVAGDAHPAPPRHSPP